MTGIKGLVKRIVPRQVRRIYREICAAYCAQKERWIYLRGDPEAYLQKWYQNRTGEALDLSCPKTFTAKQQWLKLYGRSEMKTRCTDKWQARAYVAEKLGSGVLVPVIRNNGKETFENAFEIDYGQLPDRFVIQCNHASGMTYVVKDKQQLGPGGFRKLQRKLNRCLKKNYAFGNGLELVYHDIKPLIFITKCLTAGDDLPDYKVMCFQGEPQFFWVDSGRFAEHRRNVYNLDFTEAPFKIRYPRGDGIGKPPALDQMIAYARVLAEDFSDCVRVDFYYAEDQIWFGELTFSSSSGIERPDPPEWDEKLGGKLRLPCDKDWNGYDG